MSKIKDLEAVVFYYDAYYESQAQKAKYIRRVLAESKEQVRNGQVVDGEEFFKELLAELDREDDEHG